MRFILYAVNPLTGTVSFPLTPVGLVDLLDESSGTSAQLHIIVAGNSGTPTYVNYTTTLTFGLKNSHSNPGTALFSAIELETGADTAWW